MASDLDEALFSHPFNHSAGQSIQDIAIIGERCSGTNFIRNLLAANFPKYRICENLHEEINGEYKNEYAHKHYFPWINLTQFNIKKSDLDSNELDFLNGSNQTLFVFVVRDPYDWIRSFYAQPFGVHNALLGKGFWHFLTSQWTAPNREVWRTEKWNPYKGRPFKNVLELREYKILNYLQAGLSVNHFLVIPYEKAAKHSEELIEFASHFFSLEKSKDFSPMDYYKGWNKLGDFHKKQYLPFLKKELTFINQNINWKVERLVGYTELNDMQEIDNRN